MTCSVTVLRSPQAEHTIAAEPSRKHLRRCVLPGGPSAARRILRLGPDQPASTAGLSMSGLQRASKNGAQIALGVHLYALLLPF